MINLAGEFNLTLWSSTIMMNKIVKAIILNGIFFFGSILTLYCIWVLWGRWSIKKKDK